MVSFRRGNIGRLSVIPGNHGIVQPEGETFGWCVGEDQNGEFLTRFENPDGGRKDYETIARESIIATIPVSEAEYIDPHFCDLDMADPLEFCRAARDIIYKAANKSKTSLSLPTPIHSASCRDLGIVYLAIEQKKDEAYMAVLWAPYCEAEWIYRGSVAGLRERQNEIRAVMDEASRAYTSGRDSYVARVREWLEAHTMELYKKDCVALMNESAAEQWRCKLIKTAARETPWVEGEVVKAKKTRKDARAPMEEADGVPV